MLCVLTIGAAPLAAQPAGIEESELRRRSALESLTPRQRIRIEVPVEGRLEGPYLGLRDDRFRLRAEGTELTLPVDQVRRLWVRGNRAGTGALVGGVIGIVTGAALGGALGEFACAETSESCGLELGLIGGLVLGAGGAGLGALVGLAIPSWPQRYP